jgi:hypothetical protein
LLRLLVTLNTPVRVEHEVVFVTDHLRNTSRTTQWPLSHAATRSAQGWRKQRTPGPVQVGSGSDLCKARQPQPVQ